MNPDLTFSHSFGKEGSANGLFKSPRDIAIDSQGLVYVADSLHAGTGLVYVNEEHINRVSVFTSDGVFVNSFDRNTCLFEFSLGLSFDKTGFLYFCDSKRLVIY